MYLVVCAAGGSVPDLCFQSVLKVFLTPVQKPPVSIRVDERIGLLAAFQFSGLTLKIEERTVRRQKDITRQGAQSGKSFPIIICDSRIRLVVDELGVHRGAAKEYNLVGLSFVMDLHRPGGAAGRVTGSKHGAQGHSTDFHGIAVLDAAVDMHRRKLKLGSNRRVIIACISKQGRITLTDHEPPAAPLFQQGQAAGVVEMGVTVQKHAHIFHLKAELFNVVAYLGGGFNKAAVNQDMSMRSSDEE